jgi:hypothetical protein
MRPKTPPLILLEVQFIPKKMRRQIKGKHQHYDFTSDLQAFSQVTINAARIREYRGLKLTLRKLYMCDRTVEIIN